MTTATAENRTADESPRSTQARENDVRRQASANPSHLARTSSGSIKLDPFRGRVVDLPLNHGMVPESPQPRDRWRLRERGRRRAAPGDPARPGHDVVQAVIAPNRSSGKTWPGAHLAQSDDRLGPTRVAPPSTPRIWPVMNRACSDKRKRTAMPISQPLPSRPMTEARRRVSRACSLRPLA